MSLELFGRVLLYVSGDKCLGMRESKLEGEEEGGDASVCEHGGEGMMYGRL